MKSIDIRGTGTPPFVSIQSNIVPSISELIEKTNSLTETLLIGNDIDAFKKLQSALSSYRNRISILASDGELDGIILNTLSEGDFFSFIKLGSYTRRASLVLLDNGNLRAVWKGDDSSQIGIQFRGHQSASYVIFKRGASTSHVSRVCGEVTLDQVRSKILDFGLQRLLST